ncbi:MAG: hypothetical protein ABR548_07105 [Actinomycetota bacterium]
MYAPSAGVDQNDRQQHSKNSEKFLSVAVSRRATALQTRCNIGLSMTTLAGMGRHRLRHESDMGWVIPLVGERDFHGTRRTAEHWYERRLEGGWVCALLLINRGGRTVFSELRIFPDEKQRPGFGRWSGDADAVPDDMGITSDVVRIPIDAIRSDIPKLIADAEKKTGWHRYEEMLARHKLASSIRMKPPRGAVNTTYSERDKAVIAALYVQVRSTTARSFYEPVADRALKEYGIRTTRQKVRDLVHDMRGIYLNDDHTLTAHAEGLLRGQKKPRRKGRKA